MANKKNGLFKKIISSFLSASCVLSMAAVGTALSSTTASAAITPSSGDASTFSWDNATVYFLLIDRFKNGDTSNDNAYGRQNIKLNDTRATMHGGDFKGITEKINDGYFTDLGVNAIWLTAPYEQIHGYIQGGSGFYHYSYHGYYVLDYTETDAAFGTKEEFRTLVDAAHSKGIRIVMDIVMNHAGYSSLYDMNEYGFGAPKSGWETFYKNPDESNTDLYHSYIDYAGNADGWAKWWYKWVRAGLPGYPEAGNSEETRTLDGLPDFRTDSSEQVGIPTFLQTKWTKEGTLSAKMSKYGSSNTVLGYLTTFLSEWVREYGIDGFRCDTAKHVNPGEWKVLKDKCVTALKEWKQANPTKKMDDLDFWMTGECWDWKIGYGKDKYFTQGGFNSMINFETQGGGLLAAGQVASTYQRYADAINSDPDFNVLSYVSSHDSTLARPSDMYYLGSAFLLMPGAVQIYYGDESARPFVPGVPQNTAGHAYRSDMNWGENTDLVKHWGIVGRFRNKHVAVGAGANIGLTASSGIAFGRTFDKNGITDKIAGVINASGDVTIDVSGLWADGTTLENFYDETTAVVTGGKVTFSAGAHGTILIQEPDGERGTVTVQHINQDSGAVIKTQMLSGLVGESYTVSADAELTKTYDLVKTEGKTSGKFAKEGATVKFYYHLDPAKFGTVSVTHVDAATGTAIADPTTLTGKVGETYSAQPVDVANYEVDLAASTNTSGTFKTGTINAVFKYNYVEPTGLKVHYYNANNWSSVYMYAYDERTGTAKEFNGKWPGSAMKSEGDGWFVGEADTEWAQVIFNNNAGTQEPSGGTAAKGYESTGEVWIKNGKVQTGGKVKVVYSSTDGKTLGTETLSGLSGDSYTTSAKTFDGYTLTGTPSNATGTYAASTITVTYTYKPNVTPVVNKSTLSASTIDLGKSVTVKCAASAGTSPYTYAVYYKKTTDSSWTTKQNYSSTTSVSIAPAKAVDYQVKVIVKDAANQTDEIILPLTVKQNQKLTNTSKISSKSITLGEKVTITASATGGAGSYKYAVYYKKSYDKNWTTAQDYKTNKTITVTPAKTATYNICVKVKDGNNDVSKVYFDVAVAAPLKNTSKLSATSITLGKTVTVNCSATGGTGYYNYAVYYKKTSDSKWTTAQGFSSNDSVSIKPAKATTYEVCVKVKDTADTNVKTYYKVTVSGSSALANTSSVSSLSIVKGNSVKVTCAATGGAGSYKYAVFYKKVTDNNYVTKQDYSTNTTVTIKPDKTVAYDICVRAKDTKGTIAKKYFTIAVNATSTTLKNSSTISATSVTKGTKITIKGASSGVTDQVLYKYEYKHADDSNYTTIKNYSSTTSVSFTPSKAGAYTVRVIAQDMKPSLAVKSFYVTSK